MEITAENFMQELNNSVTEMTLVIEELKKIEADTPETHDYILQLNGRFVMAAKPLEEIIKYVAAHKPDPKIVGNNLRDAIVLTGDVLTEKTRILSNTAPVYRATNDQSGIN